MLCSRRMDSIYKELLEQIGENTDRDGLRKTPQRAAESIRFLTTGYQIDIPEIVNGALFPTTSDDLVLVKDIELYSLCEHHLLPFFGVCHVGYVPNGRVLGVSKIPRIVDAFSRRLQLQEKLTRQIAESILEQTNAKGVSVVIEAQHFCMMMRGVEKQNCKMKTCSSLGLLKENSCERTEFWNLLS